MRVLVFLLLSQPALLLDLRQIHPPLFIFRNLRLDRTDHLRRFLHRRRHLILFITSRRPVQVPPRLFRPLLMP